MDNNARTARIEELRRIIAAATDELVQLAGTGIGTSPTKATPVVTVGYGDLTAFMGDDSHAKKIWKIMWSDMSGYLEDMGMPLNILMPDEVTPARTPVDPYILRVEITSLKRALPYLSVRCAGGYGDRYHGQFTAWIKQL